MENNLYYTPEISEFHVGFEYEEYQFLERNWKIVKCEFIKPDTIIDPKWFRVKTLDQSDIESLGWRFGTNDYVFPENKNVTYGQYKLLFNNNELEIIHLSGTLFRGIIKNKSELIKLMQQLNIK